MALSRVLAHDGDHELRAAAAEAGEIFHPVIRFSGDDVQSRLNERLAVSERRAQRSFSQQSDRETNVGEQRITFWNQHRSTTSDDQLSQDGKRRGGGGT